MCLGGGGNLATKRKNSLFSIIILYGARPMDGPMDGNSPEGHGSRACLDAQRF